MPKWIRILRNILFLFIAFTLLSRLFPTMLDMVSNKIMLTDEQLSNLLMTVDIVLATAFAVYSLIEQKEAEKRCIYDFSIEKDNLSLEHYRRYPAGTGRSSYCYDYNRKKDDIEVPYYGVEVKLEEKAICSVGIPLCMEVITGLDGESISFSHLRVNIKSQGKIEKKGRVVDGVKIEKPIRDNKKYLVRIQLLCSRQLEKILLNSGIYVSFTLTLNDDRGRKYKKYMFLKIQYTMGECRLLSVSSRNNWFSYIGKLIKFNYRLAY